MKKTKSIILLVLLFPVSNSNLKRKEPPSTARFMSLKVVGDDADTGWLIANYLNDKQDGNGDIGVGIAKLISKERKNEITLSAEEAGDHVLSKNMYFNGNSFVTYYVLYYKHVSKIRQGGFFKKRDFFFNKDKVRLTFMKEGNSKLIVTLTFKSYDEAVLFYYHVLETNHLRRNMT